MRKTPSVFVVSSGRSGSTLLQSILNASGQIYIPSESDFITRAYPFYHNQSVYTDNDYEQLAKLFCVTTVNNWGLSEENIVQCLKQEKPQSFGEIVSVISHEAHSLEGTQNLIWGIKRPVLIAGLDKICSIVPDAKIIHTCRDGRDVFLSYNAVHKRSKLKFGPKNVVTNVLYWIDSLRRIEEFESDRVFEIRYEDIVSQPEKVLPELFNFLELTYDDSILTNFGNHERNQKIVSTSFRKDTHQKLSSALDPKNAQKYKHKMSKARIFFFELIGGPYLKKYNYPLEYNFSTSALLWPLQRLSYFFARLVNNVRYSFRDKNALAQSRE